MGDLRNLVGGIRDKVVPEEIDPVQLAMGIQIEMEHTNDVNVAKEIAMDHLSEDPVYYQKLIKAGLAKEFGTSNMGSGYGDPDSCFNDSARIGNNSCTAGNNVVGTIGNTSDGKIDGRRSEPIVNKTLDVQLQEKKKAKKKPKPTNPSLWSRAKSMAKSKFDVYPSAYANAWAAKWYKKKGGGWRMSESNNDIRGRAYDGPFPAQVSPDGQGTYLSGYDYVGYAESKHKMKENIKKIVNRVLNEQVGVYQVIKYKLGESTYELISVNNINSNNVQSVIDKVSNKDSYSTINKDVAAVVENPNDEETITIIVPANHPNRLTKDEFGNWNVTNEFEVFAEDLFSLLQDVAPGGEEYQVPADKGSDPDDWYDAKRTGDLEESKKPNNKIMKEKSLKESIKDIIRRTLNEQEGEDISVTDTSVDTTVGVPPAEVPGAEDPVADVEEETVTITMDKDTAQKLHDLLMAQLSGEAEGGEAETETDDQLPPAMGDDEGAEQSALAEGKNGKWIQKAVGKPGALRKQLGIPAGKDIPKSELEKAAKKGGKLGKRARLALTLGKLSKKKRG